MLFVAGSSLAIFFGYVGLYACAQFLIKTLYSPVQIVWSTLFGSRKSLSERYGAWAVITGSSDGIGREYSLNLARQGMNVMLISRTESKLIKLAEEICAECNVQVRWMVVDFAEGNAVYERIQKELSTLEVGILVNNVGMVHKNPASIDELEIHELDQTLTVNLQPTLRLIHMILPEMKRRRRGMIVNMSSTSAFLTVPYLSVYSASKAFIQHLTHSMEFELQGTGVEVQRVSPFFVDTNMTKSYHTNPVWALLSTDVKPYGKAAAWLIGKTSQTMGHWFHALQITIIRMIPEWVSTITIGLALRFIKTKSNKG
ncbi:putative steroid dehydrogenase 4 [Uranotaenia lowii]|uniref:putative steroid dehydrogenase 4 n=1 Tax=Uranotaenia lowii TaxID=190385 RepID=UPI002478E654|nr:putative steroid dehydrogenase 4 [Uranotaenia lowii]